LFSSSGPSNGKLSAAVANSVFVAGQRQEPAGLFVRFGAIASMGNFR
jgi:hypothetical protein